MRNKLRRLLITAPIVALALCVIFSVGHSANAQEFGENPPEQEITFTEEEWEEIERWELIRFQDIRQEKRWYFHPKEGSGYENRRGCWMKKSHREWFSNCPLPLTRYVLGDLVTTPF